MGSHTETETIKSAKKNHACTWCGETIPAGSEYKRYRWFGGDGASVVKLHGECYAALIETVKDEGGEIEFTPGENNRGCSCGGSGDCGWCVSHNSPTQPVATSQ